MTVKKPLVIVTRKLPAPIEARMGELFDVRLNADDHPFSQAELAGAIHEADVLVPTVTDRIDARLLSQAGPDLRLIAQFGTGIDNIDVETARRRGITVTNTPGVLTEDTADMTMRSRAARIPSVSKSTITTAPPPTPSSRRNSRQNGGRASTRCCPGSTLFP